MPSEDFDQYNKFLKCLQQYEDIVGSLKRWVDLSHSALLSRLFFGQPIYKYPPPKAFSYPWYDLFDTGADGTRCDVHVCGPIDWFKHGTPVNINQTLWTLEATVIEGSEYIASWPHYKLRVRLTRIPGAEGNTFVFMAFIIETDNVVVEHTYETVKIKLDGK